MKKQSLKKVIAMLVAAKSIFALSATGASAVWRQDSRGWGNTEGNSYSKGWRTIGGTWYYFDSNGYMKTGWLNSGGWYYFSPSGVMQTGWIQDGGSWYYLKPNGTMATSAVVTDGKISKFDAAGKWLGYASSTQTNTNNTNQTSVTNNSNNKGSTTSNTIPNNNTLNVDNEQENDTTVNNQTNNAQTSSSNTQQGNTSNSSNTDRSTNSNDSSEKHNSNNNQTTESNEVKKEFTIEDALKIISEYKGAAATLTPPGPTSGIDGAYEKIHKDGKVGYDITSYLFNGNRVNNSGEILIFEDGSYKQFLQGHHPSQLNSDEWIEEKSLEDVALKDFSSHGQPTHDGSYEYYYHGKKYNFSIMQGMEQGTLYKAFHPSEFDRNGYKIETAVDYMETANIRIS
ncbi:hypothetical protein C1H57_09105 [Clostridium sp. 2-1]|uniref:hypothetical protein n=1 Tax=Clostridium TaxID=1485 RepID=UPI000CDB40D6|nr:MULTISPECIES: hypothetical protein [Clostridium]MBN7575328.1 hypothetical protein [Clostridium beijerinckii]MBN7580636.1 hypothetical protein [Clostridium beijerinckii]MBN7585092.1 hypothetical protein [Clostridium beijerinckii]MBO0520980.1 hypothetical protein [Clostridium beijerinckii]POO91662.1 hypothetical protein C1H57_09105 [Clostridium sp. 2-1]